MISKANSTDLDAIYALTISCGKHLESLGIYQWNMCYPSKKILQNDILLNQIWKLEVNNLIVGIIVLTCVEDKEYKSVKWLTENGMNLYIHRLAVLPKFQGMGYAQKLMDFAEKFAIENKYVSIRLDTFCKNSRNQRFYEKRNYIKLERIYFLNQSSDPFYCYENILNV